MKGNLVISVLQMHILFSAIALARIHAQIYVQKGELMHTQGYSQQHKITRTYWINWSNPYNRIIAHLCNKKEEVPLCTHAEQFPRFKLKNSRHKTMCSVASICVLKIKKKRRNIYTYMVLYTHNISGRTHKPVILVASLGRVFVVFLI